ncbi:MAG: ACP S-malonyltransferase [Phycisphaeraceae bacterium]
MSNHQSSIILCPGQGAQAVGMAKAWVEASPEAKAVFDEANDVLGFDLAKLCFDGPADELNRTDNAQVAIYTASVACFRGLQASGDLQAFEATAGLSLGEFTALHLAGAFRFADGLRLVRLRGEAMQAAAEATPSSMVAITGEVNETNIEMLCDQVNDALPREAVMVPANYNSPMQVVVSGTLDACELMVTQATAAGFRATPLTVAGAFHSPIMQPAAVKLQQALEKVDWSEPSVKVLSNVTGEPHVQNPALIQKRLVEQLTNPVRWSQSMQFAAKALPGRYVELAPGKVLSGLMRRIEKSIRVENFDSPKS